MESSDTGLVVVATAAGAAAYLVCYYGTARGTSICCNDDAAIEKTSDNGCSGAGGLWEGQALGVERRIAVVVGEVEARHVEMRVCCVGGVSSSLLLRVGAALPVTVRGRRRLRAVVTAG